MKMIEMIEMVVIKEVEKLRTEIIDCQRDKDICAYVNVISIRKLVFI